MMKKWIKILILLGIKESYLFLKNSWGLMVHPFKTLRGIQREKDRSQQLVFLVWPVLLLGLGAGLDWWFLVLLGLIIFLYLSFWMMKVWSVK